MPHLLNYGDVESVLIRRVKNVSEVVQLAVGSRPVKIPLPVLSLVLRLKRHNNAQTHIAAAVSHTKKETKKSAKWFKPKNGMIPTDL